MSKIKLYILFGLIVLVGSLLLAGCSGEKTIEYDDGAIYVGEAKLGSRHGKGTYTSANGDKYVGEWRNEEYISQGSTTPSSGASSALSRLSCGHESCAEEGPFLCMGKNDTCTNTTNCAYVFYCNSCR